MKNTLLESLLASREADKDAQLRWLMEQSELRQKEQNARIVRDLQFKLKQEMDCHRTATRFISKRQYW